MKRINTIILAIFFSIIGINALSAKSDSLAISNDSLTGAAILDTCHETNGKDNVQEVLQASSIHSKARKLKAVTKLNNKPEGFGDFLDDLWESISSLWKPVWGKYEEDDMNREGPYFMFNRIDIPGQMKTLRDSIKVFGNKQDLYKKIFDDAGTTIIENCKYVPFAKFAVKISPAIEVCPSVMRAKASAFVYIVGLNAKGDNPIKSKVWEQKWNAKCQKCEVRSFVPQLDEEGNTPHSKIRCFPSCNCK